MSKIIPMTATDGEIMVEVAENVQVRVVKSTLTDVRSRADNDD